ncbi:hypothetical protein B9W61_08495 [Streptomyces sp. CS057]|nr:hypothetical protein B9W61_08495 [Streptomyces sp. CS057]
MPMPTPMRPCRTAAVADRRPAGQPSWTAAVPRYRRPGPPPSRTAAVLDRHPGPGAVGRGAGGVRRGAGPGRDRPLGSSAPRIRRADAGLSGWRGNRPPPASGPAAR